MDFNLVLKEMKTKIESSKYSEKKEGIYEILNDLDNEFNRLSQARLFFHQETESILVLYIFECSRQETKMSTYLKRKKKTDQKQWSKESMDLFCEIFGAIIAGYGKCQIHLLEGPEIATTYNTIGIDSCVRWNPGLELYTQNPERVKLLVARKMDKSARGLVFVTDSGKYVLDRIYQNDSPLIPEMHKYAKERGWIIRASMKAEHNCFNQLVRDKDNNPIKETVTMKNVPGAYPYLDTFGHITLNKENNTIILSSYFREDTNAWFCSPSNHMETTRHCNGCNNKMLMKDLVCLDIDRSILYYCKNCLKLGIANRYDASLDKIHFNGSWMSRRQLTQDIMTDKMIRVTSSNTDYVFKYDKDKRITVTTKESCSREEVRKVASAKLKLKLRD